MSMDSFAKELNVLLVDTYRLVMKVEEQMLKSMDGVDLSISEVHMIESIGKGGDAGRTMSELALDLDIRLPSVSAAIKKLESKGFVQRDKVSSDGRYVHVTLTKLGKKMDTVHSYFHERMIRSLIKEITEDQKPALMSAFRNLNKFFNKKVRAAEGAN